MSGAIDTGLVVMAVYGAACALIWLGNRWLVETAVVLSRTQAEREEIHRIKSDLARACDLMQAHRLDDAREVLSEATVRARMLDGIKCGVGGV